LEDQLVSEPFLSLEHEHGMDKDAGRQHLADKAANNTYSIAGNEVNITWEGEKASVTVAGASGNIEFEDKKAILTVTDVPFAFRPMKGMIEGQIRGLMKQIYG
jgi:putative polyhydroxyalkanoate system protein